VVYENKEGLCCSARRLIGSSRSPGPLGPPMGVGANWDGQLGDGAARTSGRRCGSAPTPPGAAWRPATSARSRSRRLRPQWASVVHLCRQQMNLIRASQMPWAPLRPSILAPSLKGIGIRGTALAPTATRPGLCQPVLGLPALVEGRHLLVAEGPVQPAGFDEVVAGVQAQY
jgi:hypothetical protein